MQILHITLPDFMPFKRPALAALMHFSEFDMFKIKEKRLKCLKEKVVMIIQLSQLRYRKFSTV